MIPAIFHAKAQLDAGTGMSVQQADGLAVRRSGALIGLAGAIGAFGGVLVNLAFRQSFLTLKNGDGAVPGLHRVLRASAVWSPGRSSSVDTTGVSRECEGCTMEWIAWGVHHPIRSDPGHSDHGSPRTS